MTLKKPNEVVKVTEHNIILERGIEYDEDGYPCGEWAHEVCSKCGCRTDLMDSVLECSRK